MKRKGNLFSGIVDMDNLILASARAQKGKTKKGEVRRWNANLMVNLRLLQDELISKKYTLGEYFVFTIYEPKERIISKLPFRDRVVQHAIMNTIQDILKDSFISQTYSCIRKRGVHKCLKDIKTHLKDKNATKYVLKLDIKKFYPSINHEILKRFIRRKFKDPDLLWLLDLIIDSVPHGCVLGNFTSQWFGNIYLNSFGWWLKQDKKVKALAIYCDDIVIFHESKEYLYELKNEIETYLQTKLKLQLSNKQVFPISRRPLDFLGYVIDHDKIWIRKSIKESFRANTHKLTSIASYLGWTKHANARNLEAKLLIQ